MKRIFGCLLLALLTACASNMPAPVSKVGNDRYSVDRQGNAVTGSVSQMKADAFLAARKHCASMGKFLQATGEKTEPASLGRGPQVKLEFTCIDPHHRQPAASRQTEQAPDGVIELGTH